MRMKKYRIREGALMQAAGAETLDALAHDLRTPMCCVSGAAQMALAASRQGKRVDEQMQQILLAVEAMDRMLSQMCVPHPDHACTVDQLEEELRTVMGQRARSRGQKMTVDLSALRDLIPHEKTARLSRVLLNLTSNAIKYTQEGGEICVSGYAADGCACIVVRDNGMGMKREFIRRAFVPYERAKESAHLPGKGLGLSIVRRLVREIGGTISVRSAWGKGTAFCIRLPLDPAAA